MIVALDPETHRYSLSNGLVVPGFSEVMASVATRERYENGEYGPWNSLGGSEFCDYAVAKAFGHAFHAYAGFTVQGIECDYDPQMEPWVRGFKKYLEDNPYILANENPKFVERSLYSKKYGYAGTPDLYFLMNNGKGLVHVFDWKSTTTMQKKKVRMPTAAYEQLVTENVYPGKRVVRHAVRFFEDGYQEEVRKGHPEDWYSWLAILNTYKSAA